MSTTTLMAEILVIGVSFLLGCAVLFVGLADLNPEEVAGMRTCFKDWVPVAVLVGTALAYQLGWFLNGLLFTLFARPFELRRLNNAFEWDFETLGEADAEYRKIQFLIWKQCPEPLAIEFAVELSAIRLARAGLLSFTMIGFGLILLGRIEWLVVGLISLIVACGSGVYSSNRTKLLFKRVSLAYNHFCGKKRLDKDSHSQEGGRTGEAGRPK